MRITPTVLLVEICLALALLLVLVLLSGRRVRGPVLSAYAVRVGLSYVHSHLVPLPDSQFDAVAFEELAWIWARDGICLDDLTTGSGLYPWIGSCVYLVVGRSPLVLQILNAFFGTLIIIMAARTARLLAPGRGCDRMVAWMLALYPSLVLYSSITMREVAVVLPAVVSGYCLVRWSSLGGYRYAAWSVLWMVVSQLFHTGMIAVTCATVAVIGYVTLREHWSGLARVHIRVVDAWAVAASIGLLCAISIAAAIMISEGYGLDKILRLREVDPVEALRAWQRQVARGRASYLEGVQPRSWIEVFSQIPVRLVYFLGSPFAWSVSSVRDLWGAIDGAVLVVLTVYVAIYAIRGREGKKAGYLRVGLVLFAGLVGFAVVTSNYGTAFRHRAKFVPALVMLYACSRAERRVKGHGAVVVATGDRRVVP